MTDQHKGQMYHIDPQTQTITLIPDGPTLRDQFAMAALPALIGLHRADLRWKDCAPEAYKLADAMMEARK